MLEVKKNSAGHYSQSVCTIIYDNHIVIVIAICFNSQVSSTPDENIFSDCTGNRKALLIGINYFGQEGELKGCINDVKNIKSMIADHGFTGETFLETDKHGCSKSHL